MSLFHVPLHDVDPTPVHLNNPVFIADLHLSDAEPDTARAFIAFLKAFSTHPALRDRQELVILGDLFDAWIGDDALMDPVGTVTALTAFAQTHRVYFMHGNRDFLVGRDFAQRVGVHLMADPLPVTIGKDAISVLLSHGDRWCTDDLRYQRIRTRLRRPLIQWLLLALPLWKRRRVAAAARARSMTAKKMVTEDAILDVVPDAVLREALRFGTATVIHGHTHRPGIHPLTGEAQVFSSASQAQPVLGTRLVLADWHVKNGVVERGDALVFNGDAPERLALTNLIGPDLIGRAS